MSSTLVSWVRGDPVDGAGRARSDERPGFTVGTLTVKPIRGLATVSEHRSAMPDQALQRAGTRRGGSAAPIP